MGYSKHSHYIQETMTIEFNVIIYSTESNTWGMLRYYGYCFCFLLLMFIVFSSIGYFHLIKKIPFLKFAYTFL